MMFGGLIPNYIYKKLKLELADCESILEIGCGHHSPLLTIGYGQRTTAVEIYEPYVTMHRQAGDYKEVILADGLNYQPKEKYDAVVILDVLEHLPQAPACKMIERLESAATKRFVTLTPNGWVYNPEVDGNPHQLHVSSWSAQDFRDMGFKVRGSTGLKWIYGEQCIVKWKPYLFWQGVGICSQPLVKYIPDIAWHLYATKEIKE